MSRRVVGICCMLLGSMLLLGAGSLLYENNQEEKQAGTDSATILMELQLKLEQESSALLLPNTPAATEIDSMRQNHPYSEAIEARQGDNLDVDEIPGIAPSSNENSDILFRNVDSDDSITIDNEISVNPYITGLSNGTSAPIPVPSANSTNTNVPDLPTNHAPASTSRSEMPTLQIGKQSYIGYLELPTLGISLPVMSEWSYPQLRIAPCRYTGSVYDDSLIILAHNYSRHFGRIKALSIGDPVQFIDADGNIYQYTVAKHETLDKRDVEKMVNNEYDLSLFTCTYGGKNRITVRLNRVERFE